MTVQDDFVAAARTWIDVPWRHLGRDRARGVDCVGLLIKAAHQIGVATDFDDRDYGRRPVPSEFLRRLRGRLVQIQKREMGHGDIGVFREPRHPCHVGIVDVDEQGRRWIIHAYAPYRKVVRDPLTGERLDRLLMAFRLP